VHDNKKGNACNDKTILHCTAHHSTSHHTTPQHSTAQHSRKADVKISILNYMPYLSLRIVLFLIIHDLLKYMEKNVLCGTFSEGQFLHHTQDLS
jgi:hypothetical protein